MAQPPPHGSGDIPPLERVSSPRIGSKDDGDPTDFHNPLHADNYSDVQDAELLEENVAFHNNEHEGSELEGDMEAGDEELATFDQGRLQLFRKVPVKAGYITPYRFVVVLRILAMGGFFYWRILNPNNSAYSLWLVSVICEVWVALDYIIEQLPRLWPINRETFLDRLALKYERGGGEDRLPAVDVVVTCMDAERENPVHIVNAVLSVLAIDYPTSKVSCYVNDDTASMLTFQLLTEAAAFARIWVPFCKKFDIEPRAPDVYFNLNVDYLKDKKHPDFVKERRSTKHLYEEFKVRINALVAKNKNNRPMDGWKIADGTPWPGNDPVDHVGMIQILIQPGVNALDATNNEMPRLVYMSREKRPGYESHKKGGAMNAAIRASGLITNAPYICMLDSDYYVDNSQALRESACFFLDAHKGKKIAYVQFGIQFDGVDPHDRYNNNERFYYQLHMRGVDGIQGPVCLGTGCVFGRGVLYGSTPGLPQETKKQKKRSCCNMLCCCGCWCLTCCCRRKKRKSDDEDDQLQLMPLKFHTQRFGMCHNFIATTFEMDTEGTGPVSDIVHSPSSVLSDVILVMSVGYEENTQWGKTLGWVYCSSRENLATGQQLQARGWRSIYCLPKHRPGFKCAAKINLADRLHDVQGEALGSVETYWSKRNVLWWRPCSAKFRCFQRMVYLHASSYPFVALPVTAYCLLPAICMLTNKFIISTVSDLGAISFMVWAATFALTSVLEMRWGEINMDEWWREQQFWVIKCTSAYLGAVIQGSLKVFGGCDAAPKVEEGSADDIRDKYADLYVFRWTWLIVVPTVILLLNCFAIIAGFSKTINSENPDWGSFFSKFVFSAVVLIILYPFAKGLMGRHRRTPTIVIVWAMLLAIILSLLWVQVLGA